MENREIKFRGKRVKSFLNDTEEWVYGGFSNSACFTSIVNIKVNLLDDDDTEIIPSLVGVEVDPKTVGQFIGRLDKNGVEIFEGDFVRDHRKDAIFEIAWDDDEACFYGKIKRNYGLYMTNPKIEIIGNKFENPELLEEK